MSANPNPPVVSAPFTAEQVQILNERQCHVEGPFAAMFHPFTCRHRSEIEHDEAGGDHGLLIATPAGWTCPYCADTQDYAYPAMVAPAKEFPFMAEAAQTERLTEDEVQQLVRRIDKCVAEFLQVRRRAVLPGNVAPEERQRAKTIRDALGTMLQCLHQRRLAAMGVELRPGHVAKISPIWHPRREHEAPVDAPVLALMHTEDIRNPSHPGFGADYWIVADRRASDTTFFWSELCQTGTVTHWREMTTDESARHQREEAFATDDALHLYAQQCPHDEAYVVGTQTALRNLRSAIDLALADPTIPAKVNTFAADGEGFQITVACVHLDVIDRLNTPYVDRDHVYDPPSAMAPWQLLDKMATPQPD